MKLRLPSRRSLFFPDMAPNVYKCTCPGRRLSAGALQANGLESYQFDRDWFTIKINGSGLVRTHLRCYTLRGIEHEVSTTTCMETSDTGETCHSGKGLLVLTSAIGKRESQTSPPRQFVAEGRLASASGSWQPATARFFVADSSWTNFPRKEACPNLDNGQAIVDTTATATGHNVLPQCLQATERSS